MIYYISVAGGWKNLNSSVLSSEEFWEKQKLVGINQIIRNKGYWRRHIKPFIHTLFGLIKAGPNIV